MNETVVDVDVNKTDMVALPLDLGDRKMVRVIIRNALLMDGKWKHYQRCMSASEARLFAESLLKQCEWAENK